MTIEFFGSTFNKENKSVKTSMAINGCPLAAISFKGSVAFEDTTEISKEFINSNKALLDAYLQYYSSTRTSYNEKRKYEDVNINTVLPLKPFKPKKKPAANQKKPAKKKVNNKNGNKKK